MLMVEILLMLLLGFGGSGEIRGSATLHPEPCEILEQKPRRRQVPSTWGAIKAMYKGGKKGNPPS